MSVSWGRGKGATEKEKRRLEEPGAKMTGKRVVTSTSENQKEE